VMTWWIEELRARGHHVTLISNGDDSISVDRLIKKDFSNLVDSFARPLSLVDDIDVVHDNNDSHNPSPERWRRPYIYTVHAMVHTGNPNPVFLSFNQARFFGKTDPVVVHNGFRISEYEVCSKKDDFFLWCGAIRSCKNPVTVIDACRETRQKLKIIGPIQSHDLIWIGSLKGDVEYLGEMGIQRLDYFKLAKGFIYTFSKGWVEGFNLTNVEALLSGTAVLAMWDETNSIVKEQGIEHGKTGLLVHRDDKEGLYSALRNWDRIDFSSRRCRISGEQFDVKHTVDKYEQLYIRAIEGERW